MRATFTRDFYIPQGAESVSDEQSDAIVYIFTDSASRPCAMGFHGRAQKPDWNFYFKGEAAREKRIETFFASRRAHKEQLKARREEQKTPHDFKCGDVLCSIWGWEQTNVNFYQVVKIVGQRMIELRAIASRSENGTCWATGTATPAIGSFTGEPFRRLVTRGSVKIESYRSASRWSGKPVNWTAYA